MEITSTSCNSALLVEQQSLNKKKKADFSFELQSKYYTKV